jgi:hypothetical protein
VSFDVKCLFTNIPLKKVINIIIKRVYDEKLISTQLKKRTLIKETISTMNFTNKSTAFQSFHILDIKINPQGTTIYRKSTHTGQYSHCSSFAPWSRKIAWIRALVQRAQKICSAPDLLNCEIQKIKQFASWNGFPRWSVL